MKKTLVKVMAVFVVLVVAGYLYIIENAGRFKQKSRQSEAKANLSFLMTSELANRDEHQTFSYDFKSIGFIPEGNLRYVVGFNPDCVGQALPATTLEYEKLFPKIFQTDARTLEFREQILRKFRSFKECPDLKKGILAIAIGLPWKEDTLDVWTMDQDRNIKNITE